MAVTTEYSDLRANEVATPPQLSSGAKDGSVKHFEHTHAVGSDADSLVELFTLKSNEVLYPETFFFSHSAWDASSTIDIGHAGYTEPDGTVVAADPNAIATGIVGDVAAKGVSLAATAVAQAFTYPVDVVIVAQAKTAGISVNDTCSGTVIVGLNHS